MLKHPQMTSRCSSSRPRFASGPLRLCAVHRITLRRSHHEGSDASPGEPVRSPGTRSAYQKLQQEPRIGSEYGEGFVQLRASGEVTRLDVDTLNERLRATGAARLRHTHKPDEAFGMIFNFDSVVADTRSALLAAWRGVATARNLPLPPHVRLPMVGTCPERIIMDVLGWTRDLRVARELSWDLAERYAAQLEELGAEPLPGVRDWLTALTNFNVPCALVSQLDKATVRRALERMHLHDHFNTMITAEDDMETVSQRLLGASLQLARPPNHCVVFDDSPDGVAAAHNCTMRAVAVAGWYKAHQLKAADVTCQQLSQLTVYNVRRLFANSGEDFMDLRKQNSNEGTTGRGKRVVNALMEPPPRGGDEGKSGGGMPRWADEGPAAGGMPRGEDEGGAGGGMFPPGWSGGLAP